ncbi:MAG: hypothetical protein GY711_22690 [bacterium]|nr:hypothetical protein [bacterium]
MAARTDDRLAEGLLQNARCTRELALTLVGDPWVAEDLVQDTWVAALAHRPAADRSLRPWLATVLRNFARSEQRRAATRPAVEEFEIGIAEAGKYQLVLMCFGDGEGWLVLDEIQVGPDLQPWSLQLATGSLEIEGVDPEAFDVDIPPFAFLWDGPGDLHFVSLPMPTSAGCTLKTVPAGKGALVRPSMGTILDPSAWEVALDVEIPRGETVRVKSP